MSTAMQSNRVLCYLAPSTRTERMQGDGPFGQAHRVFGSGEGAAGTMTRPSRKDQSWMAVCSGYIADGALRGLFGFAPDLALDAAAGPVTLGLSGIGI